MAKAKEKEVPEVFAVQLVQSTSEALLWDGSNTVKVLNFAGPDWKLIQEESFSDVAGRTWTVDKHLMPEHSGECAFVGDYIVRHADGAVTAFSPEFFSRTFVEVKK